MPALFENLPKEFVSETYFYDYKTPVTETIDKIRKHGAVVVMRGKEYFGIVDDRSIFRSGSLKPLNFSKTFSVGKFAVKLPVLDSNTSLGTLISSFHQFSAKALPYREGGRITGVIKRSVVVSTIVSLHMLSKTKVGEVMSAPLVSVGADTNIAQAMSAMEKNRVARVVVLDGDKLLGLLAQRDITAVVTKPQERLPERKANAFAPANVPVQSLMHAPVYTIDFGRSAEEAARQLLEKKVSSLIVTRNTRPVGVITARDIIESAAAGTAKTQSKLIISGFDDYTKEYEQQVRDSVGKFMAKADKFEGLEVGYVSLNIKRHRERNYEMHARLSLEKQGTVFAHASGYSMESTLSLLLNSMYKRIKERKESFVSRKRMEERRYGSE